ncbi:MAG: Loki-CTERM sorting domain-containing protein [Promethearchaeota archaeon]
MKVKKSHISISLLVLILSLTVIGSLNQSFTPQIILETPKTSAGEITIVTPENITYTEPDSGYYPATYGFENDEDGRVPEGWVDTSGSGCIFDIQNSLDGHQKVLRLDSPSTSYGSTGYISFENQITGSIEFWFQKTSGSTTCYILFYGDSYDGVRMGIDTNDIGQFGLWHSGDVEWVTAGYSDNQWFHIKVDFDCVSHKSNISIDGVLYFENRDFYNSNANFINNLTFSTNTFRAGTFFIDAIGFDGDSDYTVGDNLNEGLLLRYENTTTLDWKGYSLDGQANKTIMGNTTITMPDDGLHKVQLFGNNSVGTMYESDEKYFTVNTTPYLDIFTPENKTYTEPDSGYYPASYGFENDEVDSIPEDWEDFNPEIDPEDHNTIIESFQGHTRVIEGYDDGTGAWHLRKYFNDQEGSVEFWWAISSTGTSKEHQIAFMNNVTSDIGFAVGVDQGQVRVYIPGGWSNIIGLTTLSNTWDHVRIEYCSNNSNSYLGLEPNEFRLYYNTVEIDVYPFFTNMSLDYFRLYSGYASNNVYGYYDAFGFSWDPYYSIGDNLNEGLLLSYDTNADFNWTGYSLDRQANKTILGNITIQMPADGLHNIQAFGNDSVGTMFESPMRYFTVNTAPPDITINSPTDSQIISSTAPSYDISIAGPYDSIWYALEGGTNYTATGLTGTIDQSAWSALSDGIITIDFYANNSAGMEGSAQVMVFKDSSEEPPPAPPGIPGYDLYLLIGMISIISAFMIRKRAKS